MAIRRGMDRRSRKEGAILPAAHCRAALPQPLHDEPSEGAQGKAAVDRRRNRRHGFRAEVTREALSGKRGPPLKLFMRRLVRRGFITELYARGMGRLLTTTSQAAGRRLAAAQPAAPFGCAIRLLRELTVVV